MDANDEIKSRQIKDEPWCWQNKKALRMITDAFSESEQAASARSVYVALTELASDNGSETFTATKALIAHKAGLSVSTVQRLLKGFEQLGVVHIEGQFAERNSGAIRAPNTYTLLALGHGDLTTLSHGRSRSNPDKVKEKEKKKEKKRYRVASHKSSDTTQCSFVPKIPYPETEEEMYDTLDAMGIEPNPDYDGNFFAQMSASDWTIRDEPVFDWVKTYQARLEVTSPEYR